MWIVKGRIVEHFDRNWLIKYFEVQFTEGRRLDENLYIVSYYIEEKHRIDSNRL